MEANYHNEALRKKRILDRKCEAMERMKAGFGLSGQGSGDVQVHQKGDPPLVHAEPGQYLQSRCRYYEKPMDIAKDDVVFEEVVHDPNFKYRILKDSGSAPIHVNPIYSILYPGGVRKLTYFKIGTERDRRQYDHSRNGPIVDRTRYDLKREFNFLGGSLNSLKSDIVPEHKPTPLCSKFY